MKQSLISSKDYELVWGSVTYYGNLEILELILEDFQSTKITEMLTARHHQAYLQALNGKHCDVIYRLLEVGGKTNFDDQNPIRLHETLSFAAKTGDLKLLDILYKLYPDDQLARLMRDSEWEIFSQAAEYGQLDFMEKLRTTFPHDKFYMIRAKNFAAL